MLYRFAAIASIAYSLACAGCGRSAGRSVGDESGTNARSGELARLKLPAGFEIGIYADNIENARSLALSPGGTLFVGTREVGKVYALRDTDGDFRADEVHTVATGLNSPNGVAFRDGALYVAEIHRVIRFDDIESRLDDPPEPVVVNDSFPTDRWHGWKFIRFGPDGRLYVPVGAPCNVCLREDERYAAILRMNRDGSGLEVFAHGVRNTVGFDWHPDTGELWFTDNGRDWLGDTQPPDELNRAPQAGLHFGFPYLHGSEVQDPQFWSRRPAELEVTRPALELDPHCAALGMRFYLGDMFPESYRKAIIYAEHGSWNREELPPTGYRVMVVRLDGDKVVGHDVLVESWLDGRTAWGRPVDVQELPDGSVLISDDHGDRIYRLVYKGT